MEAIDSKRITMFASVHCCGRRAPALVMRDGRGLQEAAALGQAMVADGHDVDTEAFFFASYDPPYRLTGRHNEVVLPFLFT